ncbi:MAG: replication/maintenance protein RepL [Clostridia bacterium]|nr:replication/maintenance protein RepL [Clostridia bacterium]
MIIDFSKINVENFSTEFKILNILLTLREQENVLELPLAFIEDELKISHNTLKKFLRVLRDGNVLKFSLKGLFTLNPDVIDFTDICVPSAINVLRYNYKQFQSD